MKIQGRIFIDFKYENLNKNNNNKDSNIYNKEMLIKI